MAQKAMYPTIIGDYTTALTAQFEAGTDTTITVANAQFLPTPSADGNSCTIRSKDGNIVTVKYTGKTNTTLTGVSVIQGTPTAALTATYAVGCEVSKPLAQDDVQSIQDNIRDAYSALTTHTGNTSNPHTVTKTQVGLGNCDNTADLDKPISTATQTALDAKADETDLTAHTGNTSNPHGVTKAQVGLENVDNTSDADKPVSDATQTALNGKVAIAQGVEHAGKYLKVGDDGNVVPAVGGGGVSDYNDLTNKPQINSVELSGNKSLSDLGAQPELVSGTNIKTINSQSILGSGDIEIAGVSDYEQLNNLPKINSVELTGNKTLADIGAASASSLSAHTSDSSIHVTSSQKTAWSAKQDALTFDTVPTASSNNPVTSGGIHTALAGKQGVIDSEHKISADNVTNGSENLFVTSAEKSAWNDKVSDVQLNGTSVLSGTTANITTVDNVTSINQLPLSANQGKLLNDRINNLETIGRFLSLWNCATGQPSTQPASLPYTYKTGDYYIVSVVGATANYMPNGATYTGTASTTVTTADVQTGDIWRYDGSVWSFEQNHSSSSGVSDVQIDSTSIVSAGVANIPTASSQSKGLLSASDWSTFDAKQDSAVTSAVILASGGWSNNVQTVSVTGVTDANTVIVSPAPASYQTWNDSAVRCTAQGNGTLTFLCSYEPESTITANVVIL